MKTKHTRGPWKAKRSLFNRHRWEISAGKNDRIHPTAIAETASWLDTDPENESKANACLIAAAPEHYSLLEEAVRDYDEHGPNVVSVEYLDRVRAAIAKIEAGE